MLHLLRATLEREINKVSLLKNRKERKQKIFAKNFLFSLFSVFLN
ncbi:MAG: hypothetical protein RLZZ628_3588 [Bacteroidota bacterium]|jgi:hypothetical protein